jgi:hypothetical protein
MLSAPSQDSMMRTAASERIPVAAESPMPQEVLDGRRNLDVAGGCDGSRLRNSPVNDAVYPTRLILLWSSEWEIYFSLVASCC